MYLIVSKKIRAGINKFRDNLSSLIIKYNSRDYDRNVSVSRIEKSRNSSSHVSESEVVLHITKMT